MNQISINQTAAALNKQVANWSVLYVKLHNYHWHVQGRDFFVLHSKFQELYEEAAEHVDELAERMLALNEKPVATMKGFLSLSSIEDGEAGKSAEQMVQDLAGDYRMIASDLKAGIAAAQSEGDEVTADLFIGKLAGVDKQVWMLEAYLG